MPEEKTAEEETVESTPYTRYKKDFILWLAGKVKEGVYKLAGAKYLEDLGEDVVDTAQWSYFMRIEAGVEEGSPDYPSYVPLLSTGEQDNLMRMSPQTRAVTLLGWVFRGKITQEESDRISDQIETDLAQWDARRRKGVAFTTRAGEISQAMADQAAAQRREAFRASGQMPWSPMTDMEIDAYLGGQIRLGSGQAGMPGYNIQEPFTELGAGWEGLRGELAGQMPGTGTWQRYFQSQYGITAGQFRARPEEEQTEARWLKLLREKKEEIPEQWHRLPEYERGESSGVFSPRIQSVRF